MAVGDQGVVSGDWAEAAFFGLDADVGHGGGGGAFEVAVTACGYADHCACGKPLTELGRSLMPHLRGLISWAMENFGRIGGRK